MHTPARALAGLMGHSERTLRRRLAAAHTSLRQVRDQVRAQRASDLLQEPGRSITEVALELGFADASTFARAFRRWTGRSPTGQRAR